MEWLELPLLVIWEEENVYNTIFEKGSAKKLCKLKFYFLIIILFSICL